LSTGTPDADAAATVRGSIGQTGPTTGALVAGEVGDGAGLDVVDLCAAAATAVEEWAMVEPRVGEAPRVLPVLVQAPTPTSAMAQTARTPARRNARTECPAPRQHIGANDDGRMACSLP